MNNIKSLRPVGAYRVQFQPAFTFGSAEEKLVEYLSELGISMIYSAPILKATSGSQHGYDCIDPRTINPLLGSKEDFRRLKAKLSAVEIGWLQDIVPNHMAFTPENKYLSDVFEHGQLSPYENLFDIDWNHPRKDLRGKVLIPTLGNLLHQCIANNEIKLSLDNGSLYVNYWESRFPINLGSWGTFLCRGGIDDLMSLLRKMESDDFNAEFVDLITALLDWPPRKEIISVSGMTNLTNRRKQQIAWLYEKSSGFRHLVEEALEFFNSEAEVSQQMLRELLDVQSYKLAYWRFANGILNYRRFFNINDLIALRMHDPVVFQFVHEHTLELVKEGLIDGLRVDHIDGLRDPFLYLTRLRNALPDDRWIPIYVEKILAGEMLSDNFPPNGTFDGTTGYEFLNAAMWLMVKNIDKFEKIYRDFTEERRSLEDIALRLQYRVTDRDFPSETHRLTDLAWNAAQADRRYDELTWDFLRLALREMAASLKVYRTYLGRFINVESDGKNYQVVRERIEEARRDSLLNSPQLQAEFDFITTLILEPQNLSEEARVHRPEFVLALQQYCGPLFAKGVEDWLFYTFHPLAQLGEVGGEPLPEPYTLETFNLEMKERCSDWPRNLNTLSTHDTKRSADVRARLNALSEFPDEWSALLVEWSAMNAEYKSVHSTKGIRIPDKNGEYLVYQTLLGSCPNSAEEWDEWKRRLKEYFQKAIREAKTHTNWIAPDEEYEENYWKFVESILGNNDFRRSFLRFSRKVSYYGSLNSIAQSALQITAPGIPEIYQGTEMLDLSLVDPDNRRPVDYDARLAVLRELNEHIKAGTLVGYLESLKKTVRDGRLKLVTIRQLLHARAESSAMCEGAYEALEVNGVCSENLIAFTRGVDSEQVIVLIPRFFSEIGYEGEMPCGTEFWHDTKAVLLAEMQHSEWLNVITGETLKLGEQLVVGHALKTLPIGVFTKVN